MIEDVVDSEMDLSHLTLTNNENLVHKNTTQTNVDSDVILPPTKARINPFNSIHFKLFTPKPEIGEVVVRVMPGVSERYKDISWTAPMIINLLSTTTTEQLKTLIKKLTNIPIDEMLLTFSGVVLKGVIPSEALENLSNANVHPSVDSVQLEDNELFRPRIHLSLLPPGQQESSDMSQLLGDSNENERRVGRMTDEVDNSAPHRRRKKGGDDSSAGSTNDSSQYRDKEFNLRSELALISCDQHFPVLEKAGFDSEGTFANLTESDLNAPGVWMPRRASVRILTLADTIKRRMQETDREAALSHSSHVEKDLLEAGKMTTVAIEGMVAAAGRQFLKKAELKRAWADEEHHRKLLLSQNNKASVVQSTRDVGKKLHNDSLRLKIEAIRGKCEELGHGGEEEEDEYSVRALSRRPKSPLKNVSRTLSRPTREKDGLGKTSSMCCDKHHTAVVSQREEYLAKRRMQHAVELDLILKRSESFASGFVSSATLLAVASAKVKELRYSVSDADLLALIKGRCAMGLHRQEQTVRWIAEEEVQRECLARLLPVKRYDSVQFVQVFADFLESLERKHLQ